VAKRLESAPFAVIGSGGARIDVFWKGSGGQLWWLRMTRGSRVSSPRQLDGPKP
jgi:hypothetical protein